MQEHHPQRKKGSKINLYAGCKSITPKVNTPSVAGRYCHVLARAACATKSGSANPWNSTRISQIFRRRPSSSFRPCRFRSSWPSFYQHRHCCHCPSMKRKNLHPASIIVECVPHKRGKPQRPRGIEEDARVGGEQQERARWGKEGKQGLGKHL